MKTPDLITDVVASLGPHARAMMEKRRQCCICGDGFSVASWDQDTNCCARCWDLPAAETTRLRRQPSPRPSLTTRELQAVLRETLLVLREQGVTLTDSQIEDRVGNGVMKILGLFEIHYVGE